MHRKTLPLFRIDPLPLPFIVNIHELMRNSIIRHGAWLTVFARTILLSAWKRGNAPPSKVPNDYSLL